MTARQLDRLWARAGEQVAGTELPQHRQFAHLVIAATARNLRRLGESAEQIAAKLAIMRPR